MIGAVLAGGRGRRMGGGKPGLLLCGRPLAAHAIAAVRAAGLDPVIVARPDTALPALGVPVVHDPPGPRHPFTGILAALDHAAGRPVVVVGADMPFLTAELLRSVADADAGGADAPAVAVADGLLQPLCARYPPAARDALARAAAQGAPMRATLAALGPALVEAAPEQLANVNTPADLAAAAARLCGG